MMRFKSILIRPVAQRIAARVQQSAYTAIEDQSKWFTRILDKGSSSVYAHHHGIHASMSYDEYRRSTPMIDYEDMRVYIDRVIGGEHHVLWPGRPKYFAKTSGTTSGAKYIPITSDSMSNHFHTARNALFVQASRLRQFEWLDGKMIFLSGSPELEDVNGTPTGRLSGIVNHAVPAWLRTNQLPSYRTNCIEDWQMKIAAIVRETHNQPMTLISGIPPWVVDYFEHLLNYTKAEDIGSLFPDLSFVVHGGVNFKPYWSTFQELIGRPVHMIETYPASEGFLAFQDMGVDDGLLLNTDSGIFFEFVRLDQWEDEYRERLALCEVSTGVQYVVIITSNAGLWSYILGDTVEFCSTSPYRIRVSGRIAHYISAHGEHVIAKEVEEAIIQANDALGIQIHHFTVAPVIHQGANRQSYHEWFIEYKDAQVDMESLSAVIDRSMREQNAYYDDLRRSGMLSRPVIRMVHPGGFASYMRSIGKLGSQNKVPILSNDRKVAQGLESYVENPDQP